MTQRMERLEDNDGGKVRVEIEVERCKAASC